MASQVYAEVAPGGAVVNMVQWDGVTPFVVTPNTLVSAQGQPNAQVGGTFLAGVFTAPAVPPPAQGQIFLNSPASGATVQIPDLPLNPGGGPQTLYVILEPGAALSALTLGLPATAPADGSVLTLFSTRAISGLVFQGKPINNAPSAIAQLAQSNIIWSTQFNTWFQL